MSYTSQELINIFTPLGRKPGPWLGWLLKQDLSGLTVSYIKDLVEQEFPTPVIISLDDGSLKPIQNFMETSDNEYVIENNEKVLSTVRNILNTPYTKEAIIQADGCTTGESSMPVGVMVSSEKIHPNYFSADIACSLKATCVGEIDPQLVFDTLKGIVHFGGGARQGTGILGQKLHTIPIPKELSLELRDNRYTHPIWKNRDFDNFNMTCGASNHFVNVCVSENTGHTWIVSHFGGRKPAATLFKRGMEIAKDHCKNICPDLDPNYSWIPEDEENCYYEALLLIKKWTQTSHEMLHKAAYSALNVVPIDQYYTPHNFVLRRSDGLYEHFKGSTTLKKEHNPENLKVIPLNMRDPVLLVSNHPENTSGYAPHGAGRIFSRSNWMKQKGFNDIKAPSKYKECKSNGMIDKLIQEELGPLAPNYVSFTKNPDISELPSAYRDYSVIITEIEKQKIAIIEDKLIPIGSIMAGVFLNGRKSRKK